MGTGNGGTSASSDSYRMLYSIHGRGTAGATLRGTASGNPGAVGGLRRVHTSLAARGGCRTTGGRRARRWSRRLRAYVRVRSADHQMQPSAEPHAEHTGVGGSAWRSAEDRVRLLPSDSCGWCAGIGTSAPWGFAARPLVPRPAFRLIGCGGLRAMPRTAARCSYADDGPRQRHARRHDRSCPAGALHGGVRIWRVGLQPARGRGAGRRVEGPWGLRGGCEAPAVRAGGTARLARAWQGAVRA